MTSIYENKRIVVTGAASRTGLAVAHFLLQNKAVVFGVYHRDRKGIDELTAAYPENSFIPIQADVTDEAQVKALVKSVERKTDRLDGLVNVVGNYFEKKTLDISITEWRSLLSSNLDSVFLMSTQCYPLLKKSTSARIINFGYAAGDKIMATKSLPYHIGKMGVLALTKNLAKEWGPEKIGVNLISLGTMFYSIVKTSEDPKDYIPQGRFGQYEDLWPVFDTIFREDSAYLSGTNFVLSGGYNL